VGVEARGAARLAKLLEIALGGPELSLPQFRVLALLDGDDAAAGTLAGALAVSRPSVTGLVDGLVARGLVERQVDDTDRRRVRHTLTTEGRRTLAEAEAAVDAAFEAVLAPLAAIDRARAIDALATWHHAIERAARARRHTTAAAEGRRR
jgi:long-chain acyl-CoA synthetase